MRAEQAFADIAKITSRCRRPAITLVRSGLLLTSLALAACQTDGTAMSGSGALAFDSIDGPPKATFDRLVDHLSTEAASRQVKVAARDDQSAYRVKGYMSMHVERGKASCAYAWDIYDAGRTRVARITGEEKAASVKGSANWSACDDAVLAKIADRSMTDFAQALGVSGRAAPAPAEAPAEPAATATAAVAAPDANSTASAPTSDGPVADASGLLAPAGSSALAYAGH